MSVKHAGGPPPSGRAAARGTANKYNPAIRASFSCASQGEIVVLERIGHTPGYLVAWRRDGRHRRRMTVIKSVRDPGHAISSAASLANRYVPPAGCATARPRDSQRSAVYAWEAGHREGRRLEPEELRSQSGRICRHFGVTPVPVRTDHRIQGSSFFSAATGVVISSTMNDEATLWHELAHYLAWKMAVKEASHGPAFVATLIAIRVLFGGESRKELERSAQSAGIEINAALLAGLLNLQTPAAA
jgi:hypothetical protein